MEKKTLSFEPIINVNLASWRKFREYIREDKMSTLSEVSSTVGIIILRQLEVDFAQFANFGFIYLIVRIWQHISTEKLLKPVQKTVFIKCDDSFQ